MGFLLLLCFSFINIYFQYIIFPLSSCLSRVYLIASWLSACRLAIPVPFQFSLIVPFCVLTFVSTFCSLIMCSHIPLSSCCLTFRPLIFLLPLSWLTTSF